MSVVPGVKVEHEPDADFLCPICTQESLEKPTYKIMIHGKYAGTTIVRLCDNHLVDLYYELHPKVLEIVNKSLK